MKSVMLQIIVDLLLILKFKLLSLSPKEVTSSATEPTPVAA